MTDYDGLLVSVLTEAQAGRTGRIERDGWRRTAPAAPVARDADRVRVRVRRPGRGARLAAAVSLVLASAKVRGHGADGGGLLARRPVALAARRIADRWGASGGTTSGHPRIPGDRRCGRVLVVPVCEGVGVDA
ncbi:hypothetical protein KWI83_06205 [Streptomyces sp. TRM70350]|nr:hypothetical protein [Streptomyces sp. TRM70350]